LNKPTKIALIAGGALALIAGVLIIVLTGQDPETKKTERRVPVVLATVKNMTFYERVDISGSVEAKNFAIVSARIPGVIDKIFVEEGDAVEVGKTKLFQTDKANLGKSRESAVQQVSVATADAAAKRASVKKFKAIASKVEIDTERFRRLYYEKKAITKNALELQESQLKQVKAELEEAEAEFKLAQAQEKQARSNLAIAEKNLSDSLVLTPISGKISERLLESGEMAAAGTPVLCVVDLSVVEISAFLPEIYYDRIKTGKTQATLHSGGRDIGDYTITYKSPVVNPQLRTFEIKIKIDPAPAGIVPGRLIKLGVVMESHEGKGVPMASIQKRAGKNVIFVLDGNKVKQVPVSIGLETDNMLEIASEEIKDGAKIVTKGQRFCNDGDAIKIVGGNN